MYPTSYVVFDTETTGLSPNLSKVIEIGAIKYEDHKEVDTFSMLINPKEKLSPFITSLTGIQDEDLRSADTIEVVLPLFLDFIEGYPLVAHNINFDMGMINGELSRIGLPALTNDTYDTVRLARRHMYQFNFTNYKLETIKDALGLEYGSHRALDDCYVCSSVYQLCIKYQQQQKSS